MSMPSLIGLAITILASSSLLLNLFVLLIIWRGGLLKSSGSSIYLLAFTNITSNCIQASLIAFYLGPSLILQMDLFPDGPKGIENRIFSYIELASWYTDMQVSAVIAINRVAVIVCSTSFGKLFTRKVVRILSYGLFVTGFLLALVSHILVPCCVPLFHYPSYWEEFLDEGYPYNDYIIDIPQNTISSTISIICYTIVFFYIRKIYKKIDSNLTCTVAEARRRKEVRYALQFGALSAFALFAWVGHRIFPRLLSDDAIPMVTVSIIIHGTMNSIIFLTINKEYLASSLEHSGAGAAASFVTADNYVKAFSNLAKTNNTVIIPSNPADVGSMVAQAMAIYKQVANNQVSSNQLVKK